MARGASPKPAEPLVRVPPLDAEATVELLARVKLGEASALDQLLERCIPPLRRWARGRVPLAARGMIETADLVQDTVVSALRRLDSFEARHQGALQAYLRQAVMNRIRDLVRQQQRRPRQSELPEDVIDLQTVSPLERVLDAERIAVYEAALQRLSPAEQEAIIGRLELVYWYEELAVSLHKPTANAARVAVARAMKRLVREMCDAR